MTTGMHSYGFDMQPDVLSFYYDRQLILQQPNTIPYGRGSYDRSMFMMVNLAYGGGGPGNNISYILDHDQLMYVQYVRAWQGSGGSAKANDTSAAPALSYWPTGLTLVSPQRIDYLNTAVLFNRDGNLQVVNSVTNRVLWSTNFTGIICVGNFGACTASFQNDGNFVFHDGAGKVYYATGTYSNNVGSLTLDSEKPYIVIYGGDCEVLWSTDHNNTDSYSGASSDAGTSGKSSGTVVVE